MTAVAFLGPTLEAAEARSLAPGLIVLPPAGQGDVAAALVRYRPTVIVLIDGVFRQRLAVWHKELLWAMDEGAILCGAASMGALRAAELDTLGMLGVGEVYEAFANGDLTGDDEVAVSHAGAEHGWQQLSLALVDLRATGASLRRARTLSDTAVETVLHAAKRLPFDERTWARIADAAAMTPQQVDLWCAAWVDQKADDARELLALVVDLLQGVPPPRVRTTGPAEAPLLHVMLRRDRALPGEPTPAEVVAHAAVTDPGFAGLNEAALHRGLALHLAALLDIEPDEAALRCARARMLTRLGVAEAGLESWLTENDLTADELDTLVRDEARLAHLRAWLVESSQKARNVGHVVDALRLAGRYAPARASAAAAGSALNAFAPDAAQRPAPRFPPLDALVTEAVSTGDFHVTRPVDRWRHEAGFVSWSQLHLALERARAVRVTTI